MRVPYVVAASLGLAGLAIAIHLPQTSEPFALSSALVIAVGLVVFVVIAVSGLLINRGRWSRILGLAVVTAVLLLTALTEWSPWSVVAMAAALTALFGLSGRWLSGWIRPRPAR